MVTAPEASVTLTTSGAEAWPGIDGLIVAADDGDEAGGDGGHGELDADVLDRNATGVGSGWGLMV